MRYEKYKAWIDAYLMITQLGVDVMKNLPQIPMPQYEAALEQYNQLTKRYGIGRRTYFGRCMSAGNMLTRSGRWSI